CWAGGAIAGSLVENGSRSPSIPNVRGNSGGQSGIIGKLAPGDSKSSTDTTWSQGLTLDVNGPIPVIVVDQFGYPTKASKIAVIRDPQTGYDNVAHFTPGTTYAVVDKSTGKITKQGPPTAWNGGATDNVSGDKVWWFDFSDVTIPGTYTVVDVDKSYYGPATTAASLMGAAAFAYAAKLYSARSEADLRGYGNDLATRAKKAWDWATANPSVLYYNNDDTKQPGSRGLASGQQEMDDAQRLFAKFEAAVYLYELTGDVNYKGFVESNYTSIIASYGPTQEDTDRQEALLYYAHLPGISAQVKSAILTKFVASVTRNADQLPMVTNNKDPYRSPIKDYTWGSNQSKVLQARLYQLLAKYGNDAATAAKADSAAMAKYGNDAATAAKADSAAMAKYGNDAATAAKADSAAMG